MTPFPNQTALLRKLLSYGLEVEIFGSREPGSEELFILRVNGTVVGEPLQTWPAAVTKFREAVLERKQATTL